MVTSDTNNAWLHQTNNAWLHQTNNAWLHQTQIMHGYIRHK